MKEHVSDHVSAIPPLILSTALETGSVLARQLRKLHLYHSPIRARSVQTGSSCKKIFVYWEFHYYCLITDSLEDDSSLVKDVRARWMKSHNHIDEPGKVKVKSLSTTPLRSTLFINKHYALKTYEELRYSSTHF
jgi:hypothetical protein